MKTLMILVLAALLTSCSTLATIGQGMGQGFSAAASRPAPHYTQASYGTAPGCVSHVECGPGYVCASNGYGGPGQCVPGNIQ